MKVSDVTEKLGMSSLQERKVSATTLEQPPLNPPKNWERIDSEFEGRPRKNLKIADRPRDVGPFFWHPHTEKI